jgi:hypothetical protein
MAKKSRPHRPATRGAAAPASMQQSNWFALHPNLSALIVCSFLIAIFFFDVLFSAKTFLSPDAQGPSALTVPLQEAFREVGFVPLWSPNIFCGVPSFGSLMYTPLVYLPGAIYEFVSRVIPLRVIIFHVLHYLIAGMGVYLLLRRRSVSFGPALLGGMAFMFMPYLITMEVFGHGSQMMTTAYMPLAFWAVDRLFEKRDLLSLGLAGLIIGLQMQRGHVQISYYILMLLGAFWIYSLIIRLREQRVKEIVPLTLNFIAALILAAALAAMLYLPVQEYTPYSIRGAQSVLQQAPGAQTGGDDGVGIAYATEWSFSPGEMMTFILPSFYGFGGQTYWGTMPFTDYPNYMGIAILALAFFGIVQRRPLTGFLSIVSVIALLISFGKHFSSFYQLFYDFLPYFNKFRVPVMILVVVQFSVAVMAGLGLEALLEKLRSAKREDDAKHQSAAKTLMIGAGAILAFVLLISMAHDSAASFMQSVYPDRYEPDTQRQLDQLRFGLLFKDLWMMALVLGGSLLLVAAALRKKIGNTALVGGIFLLSLVDLWVIDFKLNKPQSERGREAYMTADATALFLQADSVSRDAKTYRIFPIEFFGENRWGAQGIESIGGYHAAKPRAYQDLLDASGMTSFSAKYLRRVNQNGRPALEQVPIEEIPFKERQRDLWLLDMLNVKYVLSIYPLNEPNFAFRTQTSYDYHGQNYPVQVYENKTSLPRPFLVGAFEHIVEPKAALDRLLSGDFNPHKSVILETPLEIIPQEDSTANIKLERYDLHHIDARTQSRSPQILVLSDNYYPVGWRAYLDGAEVKTYKANFCFRAVAVPAGAHRVEFRMHSSAYSAGFWTTAAGTVVVVGLIILGWRNTLSQPGDKGGLETRKEKGL